MGSERKARPTKQEHVGLASLPDFFMNGDLKSSLSMGDMTSTNRIAAFEQLHSSREEKKSSQEIADVVIMESTSSISTEALDLRPVASSSIFNSQGRNASDVASTSTLFSLANAGVVLSIVASAFIRQLLASCVLPTIISTSQNAFLDTHNTSQFLHASESCSLFLGMLSDIIPRQANQRKIGLAGCWIWAYLLSMILFMLTTMFDDKMDVDYGSRLSSVYMIIALSLDMALVGIRVVSIAFIMEISQLEPLCRRGSLLIKFLMLEKLFQVVAITFSYSVTKEGNAMVSRNESMIPDAHDYQSKLSMNIPLIIMAAISLVTILFVILSSSTQPFVQPSRSTIFEPVKKVWYALSYEVVTRVLTVVVCWNFCMSFHLQDVDTAVSRLVNITLIAQLYCGAIIWRLLLLVMFVLWLMYLMNGSWNRLGIVAATMNAVIKIVIQVPISMGWLQGLPFLFIILDGLRGFVAAVAELILFLPLIEVLCPGGEGTMSGLFLSFVSVVKSTTLTISRISILESLGSNNSNTVVLMLVLVVAAAHLIAFVPVWVLLPHQKLDMENLKAYGRVNGVIRKVLVVIFVLLVLQLLAACSGIM